MNLFKRDAKGELAGVEHEGDGRIDLDLLCEVGHRLSDVNEGLLRPLEDEELWAKPQVEAGWLNQSILIGVYVDTAILDSFADIAIAENHYTHT
jgi:hypothetical protein